MGEGIQLHLAGPLLGEGTSHETRSTPTKAETPKMERRLCKEGDSPSLCPSEAQPLWRVSPRERDSTALLGTRLS